MHADANSSNVTFASLGLTPKVLAVLDRLKFVTPTPIQEQAIPIALEGKDLVGIAQTGTGKTLAFGLPMIIRLGKGGGRGLVVLPTRELALQVEETLRKIGGPLGLRTAVLIGGTGMVPQMTALAKDPHVIIATPGRLLDHLQQRTAKLDKVSVVVLDEADRMLDMGFAPQIAKVMRTVPDDRQTMLFSATMPPEIMRLAAGYMKLPVRIEVAPAGTTAQRVTQEAMLVHKNDKVRLLDAVLAKHRSSVLVFTRTKHGAKKLVRQIVAMGHACNEIHGNRSLAQRREALDGFKSGRYRVLVATDIASRGIDVANIGLVLNFDVPSTPDDYVHRIGRTARAGAGGHAITFVMPEQRSDLAAIERLTKIRVPVSPLPELPPQRIPLEPDRPDRPRGGFRRSSGGSSSGSRRSGSYSGRSRGSRR